MSQLSIPMCRALLELRRHGASRLTRFRRSTMDALVRCGLVKASTSPFRWYALTDDGRLVVVGILLGLEHEIALRSDAR